MAETLCRGEADSGFCTILGATLFTTILMEHGSTDQGETQAKRVRNLLSQSHRLVHLRPPLFSIAKRPERPSGIDVANQTSILPIEERRGTVLLEIVEGYPLGKMRLRIGDDSQGQQCRSQSTVRSTKHGSIVHLLRQGQELLAQFVCHLQLGTHVIIIPQSTQHGEKLVGVFQMCTEVLSTEVGLSDFRSRVAFRGGERCTQSNVHVHLALETLRGLGERLEQRQPLTKVSSRFHVG